MEDKAALTTVSARAGRNVNRNRLNTWRSFWNDAIKGTAVVSKSLSRCEAGLAVLALLILVGFSGCNRGPAMYQVRGTVLYKDGSVPKGGVAVVRLQPAQGTTAEIRKGATGAINPDGSFELYTRTPGDGVYEGEYDVTFGVYKGPMDPTPLIQAKYMNPSTSGYSVTVDGDQTDLKFEIEPLPGVTGAKASAGAMRMSGAAPARGGTH
jgi:hypothetical protein